MKHQESFPAACRIVFRELSGLPAEVTRILASAQPLKAHASKQAKASSTKYRNTPRAPPGPPPPPPPLNPPLPAPGG